MMFQPDSNEFRSSLTPRYLPPEPLALENDEVHVWRASLDLPASQVQDLQRSLAVAERRRTARYRFPRDRVRFIAARGLLRDILGRYLRTGPGDLRFDQNSHGKPQLAGENGRDRLCFNVSRSDGFALYAVTRGLAVGVDVERIRPDVAQEDIAERFFSPRETATLRALPVDAQPEAFFRCWTRKEAYIKAKGQGLSIPLDAFDVSLAPGEPAALLQVSGRPQEVRRWSLQALSVDRHYAAALAVEGHDWHLRCWQWAAPFT